MRGWGRVWGWGYLTNLDFFRGAENSNRPSIFHYNYFFRYYSIFQLHMNSGIEK